MFIWMNFLVNAPMSAEHVHMSESASYHHRTTKVFTFLKKERNQTLSPETGPKGNTEGREFTMSRGGDPGRMGVRVT